MAGQGYDAVMRGEPVYINGRVNRTIAWLARVIPQGLVRRAVAGIGEAVQEVGVGAGGRVDATPMSSALARLT